MVRDTWAEAIVRDHLKSELKFLRAVNLNEKVKINFAGADLLVQQSEDQPIVLVEVKGDKTQACNWPGEAGKHPLWMVKRMQLTSANAAPLWVFVTDKCSAHRYGRCLFPWALAEVRGIFDVRDAFKAEEKAEERSRARINERTIPHKTAEDLEQFDTRRITVGRQPDRARAVWREVIGQAARDPRSPRQLQDLKRACPDILA